MRRFIIIGERITNYVIRQCEASFRELKEERNYLFCLLVLSLAWMGVAPTYYNIITEGSTKIWLEKIYNLFNNNYLLNFSVCTSSIYLCVKWGKREWSEKNICFWHIFFIIFAGLLFYYQSPFVYANIAWRVDYRDFLISLLICFVFFQWSIRFNNIASVFLLVTIFISLYFFKFKAEAVEWYWTLNVLLLDFLWCFLNISIQRKTIYGDKYYALGFTPDYNRGIVPPESLNNLAKDIVNKLIYTDTRNESFAVGITSEWGAGKTTFLRLLKDTIGDKADVVEFNPWMCRTPEQLTKDFFSSLSHQLSKRHASLSRPIMDYARNLSSISVSPSSFFTLKISSLFSEKSLFERKKELSNKLLKLNEPVIVIIDDIDRLEREEVFEVLRLIRNTADLSNVIYLVAYDKEYVTSVLNEKKNIRDASAYLEKIFQIEIQLPKVLDERIWEAFLSDLKSQLRENKIDLNFNDEDKALILSILNTYRRAKRFARLFPLNYAQLKRRSNMLEWEDLFWLDLLQMHNKAVFDTICYNHRELLDVDYNRIVYKSHENDNRIDEKTHEILMRLWGSEIRIRGKYSIRNEELFKKYFTLEFQLLDDELEIILRQKDFKTLMTIAENYEVSDSQYYRIINTLGAIKLHELQTKDFLFSVLSICLHGNAFDIRKKLKSIRNICRDVPEGALFLIIQEWLEKPHGEIRYDHLSAIVGEIAESYILKRESVRKLIYAILQKYLEITNYEYGGLTDYDSYINRIIRYLYLSTSECEYSGQARRQDAYEYIIHVLNDLRKENKLIPFHFPTDFFSEAESTFKKLYDDKWEENLNMLRTLIQDNEEEKNEDNVELSKPPATNNDATATIDETVLPDSPAAERAEISQEKPITPPEESEPNDEEIIDVNSNVDVPSQEN